MSRCRLRRGIILAVILCLVLLAAFTFVYSRYIEPQRLVTRNVSVGAAGKASSLRIVQFGDTHIGENYSEDKLVEIAKRINAQKPDVVAFVGDLFDTYHLFKGDVDVVKSALAQIDAPLGKFAVFGNHDYGGGAVRIYADLMSECGFTVLKNEVVTVGDISIGGVDDWLMGDPDYDIAEQFDAGKYNILLSHEPDVVDSIDISDVSLALSGHTHGGQVYIPLIKPFWLPIGGENYRKGLFSLTDKSSLYVTSGIGTTKLPFRLFNPPEIVVLDVNKYSNLA